MSNVNKISDSTLRKLRSKSVYALPDNPSANGLKASATKPKFYEATLGSNDSVVSEINRIVNELNAIITSLETADTTNSSGLSTLTTNVNTAISRLETADTTNYNTLNGLITALRNEMNIIHGYMTYSNNELVIAASTSVEFVSALVKATTLLVTTLNATSVNTTNLSASNTTLTGTAKLNGNNIATENYVGTQIQNIIGIGTPEQFDTLKEIADYLSTHASEYSALVTSVNGKVDKVSGKGLSTNDFTNGLKTQVENIGDLTSLETTEKSTIVDAINSLVSATPSVAKATSEEIIGMRG